MAHRARASRHGHRLERHGAEVAVTAWAPTRAACIAEAMLTLATQRGTPPPSVVVTRPLEVRSRSAARLLATALGEAISLLESEGLVPIRARLRDESATTVHGEVDLVPLAYATLRVAAPKAVSHHDLLLEADDGEGWLAHAVIDL